MQIIQSFVLGMFTVLRTVGVPLLYRYPYRNSAEALRSDWQRIATDIESVIGQMKEEKHYE